MKFLRVGIVASFFLSGCAALIYETLWVRLFSLYMGHTTIAVSSVLAAFMAGLSIGSFIGGKAADNAKNNNTLLKLYALLEAGTFILVWFSRPAMKLVQNLTLNIGILETPFIIQGSIWFLVSFSILIIPTALMGATLPVIIKWMTFQEKKDIPDRYTGLVYGINTLGAVFGCAIAGFYLIPEFGITNTFFTAGIFNICASAFAFLVSFVDFKPGKIEILEERPSIAVSKLFNPGKYAALLILAGCAAMILEVGWTRTFASILGSSTYAFSIMLFTYLLGFSAGSITFGILEKYLKINLLNLSIVFGLISLSILSYLPLVNRLPYWFTRIYEATILWPGLLPVIQFLLCAVIMIVPTFFMGILFPWSIAVLNPDKEKLGSSVGFLYSANTIGNIIGSVLAGLVLIPFFGTESTIVYACIIYGVCFILCSFFDKTLKPLIKILLPVSFSFLLTAGIYLRPKWDPYLITSGAFNYAEAYKDIPDYRSFVNILHESKMLFFKDGLSATIAVIQSPWGKKFLRTNGKTDASTGEDMPTQVLQGYIPSLIYPGKVNDVLLIGLGSGVSMGSVASDKNVRSIDCVEIEPSVVNAAAIFSQVNHFVMQDKRLKMIFADGRNYLSSSKKKYDIIISEPSNPWISGISNLFTKEAFELAKEKLSQNGIFCQWFHSYSMGENDFIMIMKTFAEIFPNTMLFAPKENDFFLIGSVKPFVIDYNKITKAFETNPTLQSDMLLLGLGHPFTMITSTFVLDDKEFREFCKYGRIHTDDRPILEFSAPKHLYSGEEKKIASELYSIKTNQFFPASLKGLNPKKGELEILYNMSGESFMRAKNLVRAENFFYEALKLNSKNPRTLTNLGRAKSLKNEDFQAERYYEEATMIDPKYSLAWFHLGKLYVIKGLEDKGLKYLEKGLENSPGDPMGSLEVALLYIKRGRKSEAIDLLQFALSKPIFSTELHNKLLFVLNGIKNNYLKVPK